MSMTREELLEIAKTVEFPVWVRHVAVLKDGTHAEPAIEVNGEFYDCTIIDDDNWLSARYLKKDYWEFFSIAELNTEE